MTNGTAGSMDHRDARRVLLADIADRLGEGGAEQTPKSVHLPTLAREVLDKFFEGPEADPRLADALLYGSVYALCYEAAQRRAAQGRRGELVKLLLLGENLVSPEELGGRAEKLGARAFARWRENVAGGQVLLKDMVPEQNKDAARRRFARGEHEVRLAWFQNTLAMPLSPMSGATVGERYGDEDLVRILQDSAQEAGNLSLGEMRRAIEAEA